MTESFWLVIAGGVVGVVASLIPLLLQRRWQAEDRRRALDTKALEAAVDKLVAWQSFAVRMLGTGELPPPAEQQQLAEFDRSWEADFSLIPDQKATRELIDLCRGIYFFAGPVREGPDAMERLARLTSLLDRVTQSAQKKRRELA